MRLTTWNVNGIRNPFGYQPWNNARTFPAMFDILGSDIVVMQELKIQRKDLRDDMVLLDGWDCYFSLPKHKKGYSGVGIYTRNATCAPIRAEEGLLGVLPSPSNVPYCDLPEVESIGGYPNALQVAELGVDPAVLDAEGRCVVVEFPAFVLIGVYSPANSNGQRDDFRYGFICALDCRIRNLVRAGKRVVLVGDLNVSRDEQDGASAADDMRKNGITHEEYISTPNRRIFNQLLLEGEVVGDRDDGREHGVLWDTTRGFHPDRRGMYTHWEQKINARPGNFGSRIDFVLVCEAMRTWVENANIQEGLLGSDHCPVFADFKAMVTVDGSEVNLLDLMSPPGTFQGGQRVKDWRLQDAPPFSAKRLPEFDKRRSIKSMFAAPAAKLIQTPSIEQTSTPSSDVTAVITASQTYAAPPVGTPTSTAEASQTAPKNTQSPALKRTASAPLKSKITKRQKSTGEAPKLKGQQSLKGFFQKNKQETEKASNLDTSNGHISASQAHATLDAADESSLAFESATESNLDAGSLPLTGEDATEMEADEPATPSAADAASPASTITSPSQFATKLAAAEQNQKSWGALFSRPVAPLCEGHSEPCKTMLTKKKGSNQGRSFWMCARPLGPSGSKERGTQWRCPTFIWCSDWQARKDGETVEEPG